MKIPTWFEVDRKLVAGVEKLTPVEAFIHEYEPAGSDEVAFRHHLQALIDYVKGGGE